MAATRKAKGTTRRVRPAVRWEVGNLAGLPTSTPDGEKLTWVVREKPRLAFGFVDRGERIVWTSFAYLGGEDEEELSSRSWRNLNLASRADDARKVLAVKIAGRAMKGRTDKARAKSHHQAYVAANARLRGKRKRGTHYTEEEVAWFASLYRAGLRAEPKAPLKYVQEQLGRDKSGRLLYPHRSSAQRRVDAARRAGLLDDIE